MKGRLSYFMVIAAALSLGLASCSKDATPAKDIAKEYKDAELVAKNGNVEVKNSTVKITALGNTSAEIELTNLVNGQASFKMNAEVTEGENQILFKGTKAIDGMNVTVDGSVAEGKAIVNVAIEMTSAEILNTWVYGLGVDTQGDPTPTPFVFAVETTSGKVPSYFGMKDAPVEMFNEAITGIGNLALIMTLSDLSLTFAKDGYVSVKNTKSPAGLTLDLQKVARYYYNPTTKVLSFDVPLDGLLGKADAPQFSGTIQIPFNCKFDKDGVLTATIDYNFIKPFLSMIPTGDDLNSLLDQLDSIVPPSFVEMLPMMKMLVNDLAAALQAPDLTNLTIGGKLRPQPKQ